MINVSQYIELILVKKGWTRTKLREELNRIETKLGDKKTSVEMISDYMRGRWAFRPKMLAKWEKALELKEGTLMNMVMPPITKEGKEELKETINRLRRI